MAIQTVYADAHISGSFVNPANAVGNTPTTWAGSLNVNSNYTSRWSLADLVSALTPGATQTINVLAKKGSNSGTPTIAINLYENGSLVSGILSATNVTSTTGQTLTATFNTSQITNPNNVEIELVEVGQGGSGSARNSAQVAYIAWVADVDTDPKNTSGSSGGALETSGAGSGTAAPYNGASGSSGGVLSTSGAGQGSKAVSGESSGTFAISGAGSGTSAQYKVASGSSGGSVSVTGAGSGGEFRVLSGASGGSVAISGEAAGAKGASGEAYGDVIVVGAGSGAGKSPMVFLTKQIKRNGTLTPAAVYKKNNGLLVQTGGHTR